MVLEYAFDARVRLPPMPNRPPWFYPWPRWTPAGLGNYLLLDLKVDSVVVADYLLLLASGHVLLFFHPTHNHLNSTLNSTSCRSCAPFVNASPCSSATLSIVISARVRTQRATNTSTTSKKPFASLSSVRATGSFARLSFGFCYFWSLWERPMPMFYLWGI